MGFKKIVRTQMKSKPKPKKSKPKDTKSKPKMQSSSSPQPRSKPSPSPKPAKYAPPREDGWRTNGTGLPRDPRLDANGRFKDNSMNGVQASSINPPSRFNVNRNPPVAANGNNASTEPKK